MEFLLLAFAMAFFVLFIRYLKRYKNTTEGNLKEAYHEEMYIFGVFCILAVVVLVGNIVVGLMTHTS